MKIILYCRKSSESEDRQIMSLSAQETELRKIAERDGMEIVKVFHESMSAKAPGRPLFAEMLQMVTDKKADAILCWKLDRLARNSIDGGKIIWLLQNNQIKLIRTYEKDYLPEDNVLLMYVEFGMSNQYVRDLSANVKRGNREKLRNGEWPNRAPYGYRNDKNTKTLKIIKSQADKVREVFKMYASGKFTLSQISIATGFAKSHIGHLLERTFYYGMMEWNNELHPGKHPAIISKELFDTVQLIKKGVTVRPAKFNTLFFPYRGFLRCAVCGCQLTATKKKEQYDYYYCTNGKKVCDQHHEYLSEKAVDSLFGETLSKISFDEELVEMMYEAARERHENGHYDTQKVLDGMSLQLHQLKQQERKLLQSYTTGLIDDNLYREEAKALGIQKTDLESKIKNYTQNSQTSLSTLELVKSVFLESNRAVSEYKNSNPEKKRKILEKLLWNLEIKDKKVANYSFRSPYQVLANAPKKGDLTSLLTDTVTNT